LWVLPARLVLPLLLFPGIAEAWMAPVGHRARRFFYVSVTGRQAKKLMGGQGFSIAPAQ
jgi:hypothetical protein